MLPSEALLEVRNGQWAKLEAEGRILGKNVNSAIFLAQKRNHRASPDADGGVEKTDGMSKTPD